MTQTQTQTQTKTPEADLDLLREAGVTERFLERLAPLLEELDGDAGRLMGALEERSDDRVKGIRHKTVHELRARLTAERFVDE